MGIVPLGTDQKIRSFPYITVIIIAANTLIWLGLKDAG